jgi:preprotein translocase subunit SecE
MVQIEPTNEMSMSLPKVLKKMEEDRDTPDRAQKMEPSRKAAPKPMKPKKESTKKVSKKPDEPRFEWWNNFRLYLREVGYELRKVVWPSRKETIGTTSVVLVIVMLAGIFLGIVDLILSRFIRLLVG